MFFSFSFFICKLPYLMDTSSTKLVFLLISILLGLMPSLTSLLRHCCNWCHGFGIRHPYSKNVESLSQHVAMFQKKHRKIMLVVNTKSNRHAKV